MGVHSGPDLGPFYRQRGLNDRLLRAERAFLDSEGIPGYSWYKHLVLLFTLNQVLRLAHLLRRIEKCLLLSFACFNNGIVLLVSTMGISHSIFSFGHCTYVKLCISFIMHSFRCMVRCQTTTMDRSPSQLFGILFMRPQVVATMLQTQQNGQQYNIKYSVVHAPLPVHLLFCEASSHDCQLHGGAQTICTNEPCIPKGFTVT